MKNLYTYTLVFILSCILASNTHAQGMQLESIELSLGQHFSSFRYKNSAGEKDQTYNYVGNNAFGVHFNLAADRHVLRPTLGMRQAGAQTTFENTPVNWKLNYLETAVGYLFHALKTRRITLSPGIAVYGGYLLNGSQSVGDQRFSLTESEALKSFDFGVQGITRFGVAISDQFAFALEYRFQAGIAQIENEPNAQETRNIGHSVLLGLTIQLK